MVTGFENRKFIIFDISEISAIDFNQVFETSDETLRISVDQTQGIVKYEGEMPSSISSLTSKQGPYTYEEMLEIVQTPEWSPTHPYI